MPKTLSVTAYTLEELREQFPKGYERAMTRLREWALLDDWYIFTLEDWTEKLAGMGFEDADIQFRGFSSQGDGASFTASVDLPVYMRENHCAGKLRALYHVADGKNKYYEVDASIRRDRGAHYVHEYTIRAEVELVGSTYGTAEEQKLYDQIDTLTADLTGRARELSREIYRALEAESEYLTSDEMIHDNARENEYLFLSSGAGAPV